MVKFLVDSDKSLGALNTIHRRRDLLAGIYLGAVVVAVIVRLQLTGTCLCLIAEITRISPPENNRMRKRNSVPCINNGILLISIKWLYIKGTFSFFFLNLNYYFTRLNGSDFCGDGIITAGININVSTLDSCSFSTRVTTPASSRSRS